MLEGNPTDFASGLHIRCSLGSHLAPEAALDAMFQISTVEVPFRI